MRRAAKRTAGQFTWDAAVENLIGKLANQARSQGSMAKHAETTQLSLFDIEVKEESPDKLPELGNKTNVDEFITLKAKISEEVNKYDQNNEAGCREILSQRA